MGEEEHTVPLKVVSRGGVVCGVVGRVDCVEDGSGRSGGQAGRAGRWHVGPVDTVGKVMRGKRRVCGELMQCSDLGTRLARHLRMRWAVCCVVQGCTPRRMARRGQLGPRMPGRAAGPTAVTQACQQLMRRQRPVPD